MVKKYNAFVDDKRLYANNWTVNKPKLINAQLEKAANDWNELLTTTGGGLELTKCSHDTLHWRFNKDGTVTTSEIYDNIEIKVKKNNSQETSIIKGLSAKDKVTNLGKTSSRDGNPQHQLEIALNIAKEGARILLSNSFNNYKAFIYRNSHFISKLIYPFTSACFTSNQYENIEATIILTAIAKMRFNRSWPIALRYRSHLFGGLGLRKLKTEATIKKIQGLQSLMEKSESSKLIMIALQWHQLIYGVSYPLLVTNKPFIEYGNSKWFNHFTQLLRKYRIHLNLQSFETPILQRENDVYIMDILTKNIPSRITLQRINACRLYLNISLLSEFFSSNGKLIKQNILQEMRNSIESTTMWSRQKSPEKAIWTMWISILKRNFCSCDNTPQSQYQLGSRTCSSNQLRR